MCKKILSVLLCAIFVFCAFSVFVIAEDGETVCTTAADMLKYVIIERSNTVPIRIVPATLEKDAETTPVYLIGLLGVKENNKQVNSGKNLVPAAFHRPNSYYDLVKETILATIPEGSNLVFACHSLGGMVAQHLRTDEDLKANYEIINVLTAGSPLILVNEEACEGELHRLADKYDVIPFMSPATILNLKKQINSAAREDGGYFFNPDGAHNLSYLRDDVWGAYDVFGVKDGNATLSYNASEAVFYGAVQ